MKKTALKTAIIALILCVALVATSCRALVDVARDYLGSEVTSAPTDRPTEVPTEVPTEQPEESDASEPPAGNTPTPSVSEEIVFPDIEHGTVKFSDMVFVMPDTDALIADIERVQSEYGEGADAAACLEEYESLCQRYTDASSMASIAYILYCLDVTNDEMQQNYEDLNNSLTDVSWRLTDLGIALIEDPASGASYSQDYIDMLYLGDMLNDESIQDLVKQETELTSQYEELNSTFTIEYNGQQVSYDDISSIDDSTLIYRYFDEFNAAAGEIYIQLVDVRTEIATTLGYDNYTDYAYDSYDRDFSPEDSLALGDRVKAYIAPLYFELIFEYIAEYYGFIDNATEYEQASTMESLRSNIEAVFPELIPAWDYMIEYELYNFDLSDVKMEGSYSTTIENLNAPFMYSHWDGDVTTISTIIHEFGHYSNFYLNPDTGWNSGGSLDLAEVDSQGLELLMLNRAEQIYGAENADSARVYAMMTAMYVLIAGCMEDEFQQYAYANPDATLEDLNAEYYRIAQEYGFDFLYGYSGTEWAMIHHHFQSPMYYISYATSMLGALQVFAAGTEDYDAACHAYLSIQSRPQYSKFRETLISAGLSDPFDETLINEIATTIRSYLAGL
ncbi:MAG: hypothetical protein Q4C01_02715 [Clostridia bacterium]|nr:hypothetical protein [Clostridia bacterium]